MFALAYGPAPLFTSNQNQYFLHGLANAGLGYLDADWLANTVDPTPLFSLLIEWTYRLFPWPPVFYLYFAGLAGVFLFSLVALMSHLVKRTEDRLWQLAYLALLTVLFSAAVRVLAQRWLGEGWLYPLDGGLAGQRLLGDIFQPSQFGVLLLLSIWLFWRGKYGWAVFFLALSPSLHPTYLLSAALLTLVYMGLLFKERRTPAPALFLGLGALLAVTPILVHTYGTFVGGDPSLTAAARQTLVEMRIPHHAVVADWFGPASVVRLGFILLGIYLARGTRLLHILVWPSLAAVLLTALQVGTGSQDLALLFPWRVSTWLVPLAVSLIAARSLDLIFKCWPDWIRRHASSLRVGLLLAVMGVAVLGLAKSMYSWHQKLNAPERALMAYVRSHKEAGEVYLVDLKWQTFRLETGAPLYVDYKAIPYLSADVLEWKRRIHRTSSFYQDTATIDCQDVIGEWVLEGVTHLVMPVDHPAAFCPGLILRYQDVHYRLYELADR